MRRTITLFLSSGALLTVVSITSCKKEQVLNNCQINTVRLDYFPETNSIGDDWDSFTSYPDIFVRILKGSTVLYTSGYYDECQNPNDYDYTDGLPVYLEEPDDKYKVEIYDFDSTSEDEWMDGFEFTPSPYRDQSIITLSSVTSEVEFTLFVQWNYTD